MIGHTFAGTTERLLANRLGHTPEPAFGFEQQVTVWNRPGPGRLTLHVCLSTPGARLVPLHHG